MKDTKYNQYKALKKLLQFDPAQDDFSQEEFAALSEDHQEHILEVCQTYLDCRIDNIF